MEGGPERAGFERASGGKLGTVNFIPKVLLPTRDFNHGSDMGKRRNVHFKTLSL